MKLSSDVRFIHFWQRGLGYAIMFTITIMMAVPLAWMLTTALRPENTVRQLPIQWIPPDLTLNNFISVLKSYTALGRWFLNSALVATATTLLSILIDSLGAYALARMEFFGKKIVFLGILATMLIPTEATLVPLYIVLARSKVLVSDFGTYLSLILPVVGNAFALYLLTQFFQTIPKDLEDSARIDGCTEFGIWRRVIMPLSAPGLTAAAIFTFMASWNNFVWPFIVTNTDSTRTLPVGLANIFGSITASASSVRYGEVMAGMTLATLPPVIIFILLQRYFVQGISMTGIKG